MKLENCAIHFNGEEIIVDVLFDTPNQGTLPEQDDIEIVAVSNQEGDDIDLTQKQEDVLKLHILERWSDIEECE